MNSKKKLRLKKEVILFLAYLILLINMILGIKVYSVDFAFIFFIFAAIILFKYKINSDFLFVPPIFLLMYLPILLLIDKSALANDIVSYVFYFLVIGIALKFLEYIKNTKLSLGLDDILDKLDKEYLKKCVIIFSLLTLTSFVIESFTTYLKFGKWNFLYFSILFLSLYFISFLKNNKQGSYSSQERNYKSYNAS